MKMSRRALLLARCLAIGPALCAGVAMGADSTLVVVMGGEAYDGPPAFEVSFGGQVIGEGTVAAAIDTAKAGRFADAADKMPYVQTFTFIVPEAAFRTDGDVNIRFLNEAYGGEGSGRDRNLFLASISVNGRAVTSSGLSWSDRQGLSSERLGEFLVIPDGRVSALSEPPQGGWPRPLEAMAAPGPVRLIAASAPAEIEPIETAWLDPDPESSATGCDLDEKYNVIGFNPNSNDLTPQLVRRLDQVAEHIGDRRCRVIVTGYSSVQGSLQVNALFAIERAQTALRYLEGQGVQFVSALATGGGATADFGPDLAANRRVVISITP